MTVQRVVANSLLKIGTQTTWELIWHEVIIDPAHVQCMHCSCPALQLCSTPYSTVDFIQLLRNDNVYITFELNKMAASMAMLAIARRYSATTGAARWGGVEWMRMDYKCLQLCSMCKCFSEVFLSAVHHCWICYGSYVVAKRELT